MTYSVFANNKFIRNQKSATSNKQLVPNAQRQRQSTQKETKQARDRQRTENRKMSTALDPDMCLLSFHFTSPTTGHWDIPNTKYQIADIIYKNI